MPNKPAQVVNKQTIFGHHWADDVIERAVVASVRAAHYGDDTDDAKHYVLAIGDTAPIAKRAFANAEIHLDRSMFAVPPKVHTCLLAFCERDDAIVAFYGLKCTAASSFGSQWMLEYEHVSAREMTEA